MPLKFLLAIFMAFLPLLADEVRAGASFVVDDAAMTPAARCQAEMWMRAYTHRQEATAVPACNFANTEFSLGLTHYARPSHGPVAALGVKRLFHDFGSDDWGIGASLGATWDGASGHFSGWNFNIPASFAIDAQKRTVLHANLGWNALPEAPDALTAGLGIERALAEEWTLLGEAYGDHRGALGVQAGLRRHLGEDATLDLIAGHQYGSNAASWLTLGINVLLPH